MAPDPCSSTLLPTQHMQLYPSFKKKKIQTWFYKIRIFTEGNNGKEIVDCQSTFFKRIARTASLSEVEDVGEEDKRRLRRPEVAVPAEEQQRTRRAEEEVVRLMVTVGEAS